MKQKCSLSGVAEKIEDILDEFLKTSFEVRQEALEAGAKVLKNKLEEVAPNGTGDYRKKFIINKKYKDKKYVGNTKMVNHFGRKKDASGSRKIPLSNLLEFGDRPHIRNAFDSCEQQIFNAIKTKIENGGKK